MRLLGAFVAEAAARHGAREALVAGDRRLTFAGFAAAVDATARALVATGVGPGDRLALWMPNRLEWLATFYAAATLGAVVVPLNTRFRELEVKYVLAESNASLLVMADRFGPINLLGILGAVRDQLPALRTVVVADEASAGTTSWDAFLAGGGAVASAVVARHAGAVRAEDPVLLLFTSGTTGRPKGVLHGHAMMRTVVDGANRLGVTPRDTLLMALPFFHSMGLYEGALLFLATGARGVLMERFDAAEALRLLARERVTFLAGFDTHYQDLLAHADFAATPRDSLRLAFLPAGLATTETVARRVNRELCPSVSTYGSTEAGTGICLSFLDDDEDARCRGLVYPLPGYEVAIVDPATGAPVPAGAPGELLVRGYGVAVGYWAAGEGAVAAVDAEGWFHTGDMAVVDGDGFLRFLGRYKDMLKVGGENVDPLEIEAFLATHPAVAEVRVVGVPDPRLQEVPVACVQLRAGTEASAEEIVAYCQGRIAGFKIPRRVLFVADYPMTASGKVQRGALRQRVLAALAADG